VLIIKKYISHFVINEKKELPRSKLQDIKPITSVPTHKQMKQKQLDLFHYKVTRMVYVVSNCWNKAYHIEDQHGFTVDYPDQPSFFPEADDAMTWARERGYNPILRNDRWN
jgi:hypothetical protein